MAEEQQKPNERVEYNISNPHPMHGKDPNILNEFGHTEYPKFLHKFHPEKGHIMKTGEGKFNDPHDSIIVNDEDEEADQVANGYAEKWIKPDKVKVAKAKTADWDQEIKKK